MAAGLIGSRAVPDPTRLRQSVRALSARTHEFLDQADNHLGQAHNAFTVYTAMLLMCGTGHRPVVDPFCYPIGDDDDCTVVEDKAVIEQRAQRLVVLPGIAKEQVRNYRMHLTGLAGRLRKVPGGKALARSVGSLLQPMLRSPHIPFLFLLRDSRTLSLAPSTMMPWLADWPYPLNLGRHLIATGLLRDRLPAECITFQLGHLGPETSSAGPESLWSPALLVEILQPALDKLMKEQGWQALPGLRPSAFTRNRVSRTNVQPYYHHGKLGPDIRKHAREMDRQRDQEDVRELIAACMPEGAQLNQGKLEELIESVRALTEGNPGRAARQIAILRGWARTYEKRDPALRLPLRECLLLAEPARFDRSYPARLAIATRVIGEFKRYLRDGGRSGKQVEPELRRAETVVSAALFGGIIDARRLRAFAHTGPESTVLFYGVWLCDAERASENTQTPRWLPDDITVGFLVGGGPPCTLDVKEVRRCLRGLLGQFAPGVSVHKPFHALATWARAYWQQHLPGALLPVLDATTFSEPLPLSALARLHTHGRLAPVQTSDSEAALSALPPVCIGSPTSRANDLATYRKMHAAFQNAAALEARGTQRFGRLQRQTLLKGLKPIGQNTACAPSPLMAAILAWAMQLCTHGTRWHSQLKFSTIKSYVFALDRVLIECTGNLNFLMLSDSEFGAIYRSVLDRKKGERRAYTGARLLEFHAFLAHAWGVEVPDWSFLPPESWRRSHAVRVDANVLALNEYRAALKLLYSHDAVDEQSRLYEAALLVLGYRFGLRISEALRTRYDDLFLDREHGLAVVNVEANIYGGLKSDAATRRVPLIGTMEDIEWEILEKLRAAFAGRLMAADRIASLFANPTDPRAPIERRLLMERIHAAMRLVSGDESLHYHHLRHTFASKLLMGVMADFGDSKPWTAALESLWGTKPDAAALRGFLTGHNEPFNVSLEAVASLMGHASLSTTLESYMHFIPEVAHGIGATRLPPLSDRCWAYALKQPHETIRKRITRAKAQGLKGTPLSRKWPPFMRRLTIPMSPDPLPDALPRIDGPVKALDLETVDWILQAVSQRGGTTKGVADCMLVPEATVFQLVERARTVQRRSGYSRLNLTPPSERWTTPVSNAPVAPIPPYKESRRVKAGLRAWQRLISTLDASSEKAIAEGLKVWLSLPEGGMNYFLLPDRETFRRFVDALRALDVPREKLRTRHLRTNQSGDLNESLRSLGFDIVSEKDSQREAVSLSLVPGTPPWSYTSSLARGLFVLAVDGVNGTSFPTGCPYGLTGA